MITEEMLREAAERSCALHTEQLESACAEMPEHRFSPETEARILSMGRKHSRKAIYQFLLRTAAMLGVVILVGALFLNFDAVANYDGWTGQSSAALYIYTHEGKVKNPPTAYRLSYIPEGYREVLPSASETECIYEDAEQNFLIFSFIVNPANSRLYVQVGGTAPQKLTVNGYTADFFAPKDAAATLIWWDENDRLFYLRGFFDAETLIQMAESIEIIEN